MTMGINNKGGRGPHAPAAQQMPVIAPKPPRTQFSPDSSTFRIFDWLKAAPENRAKLEFWLEDHGHNPARANEIISGGGYSDLRRQIMKAFQVGGDTFV